MLACPTFVHSLLTTKNLFRPGDRVGMNERKKRRRTLDSNNVEFTLAKADIQTNVDQEKRENKKMNQSETFALESKS